MASELPHHHSVEIEGEVNLERIISDVHRISYEQRHVSQDDLEGLMRRIKKSELSSEFLLYEKKIHPTLEMLERSGEIIVATLKKELEISTDQEEGEELQKHIRFFSHRIKEINNAITRYCDAIAQFEIQNNLRLKYPERSDTRTKFEQADKHRRLMHDNLFMVLRTFSQQISSLIEDGYIQKKQIQLWDAEKMASATEDNSQYNNETTIHVFHSSLLDSTQERNRKLIQEWAITADLSKNLKQIIHIFEEQKEPRE